MEQYMDISPIVSAYVWVCRILETGHNFHNSFAYRGRVTYSNARASRSISLNSAHVHTHSLFSFLSLSLSLENGIIGDCGGGSG